MKAVRIQFKQLGKRYFFGCEGFKLHDKDKVIVNTIRGLELGTVVGQEFDIDEKTMSSELKEIVRMATDTDIARQTENRRLEPQIIDDTKKLVKKSQLEMKILGAEFTLDKSKLIIYFEAEGRIDFRNLVKDLAEIYRTRIELRQVGSRDGAKAFGGIGPCGLIVCCKTFLTEFDNVGVKMAKNQNLSLNPLKISGNCGKLLCCINYEDETYKELRRNSPDLGDIVETEEGRAKVITCDVLNKTVKVKYLSDDHFGYLKFEDIQFTKSKDKNKVIEEIADDEEIIDGNN